MKKIFTILLLIFAFAAKSQTNPQNYSFSLQQAISHALTNNYQAINASRDIAKKKKKKWHIFFRSYEEMAENRIKQQKSMSLSLTSETAVEYTIWPANDTYIITVCWVMKNREKQMISTSKNSCWVEHEWWW